MTTDRFTWKPGDIEWESGEKGVKWETGGAEKSGVPHTADTPSDEAIAERGRDYWRTHVAWGKPGDFMECVRGVVEHAGMSEDNAKGYCNLRHHEVTGEYAGPNAHKIADATVLKMVDLDVGLAVIKEETGGHVPPRFAAPRDNRSRFRKRTGTAGEHGAFAPGEKDATGLKPLEVGSESDMAGVSMDEVENQRHRAPGEDGYTPDKAGTGIPPDVVQHQDRDHVIEDAIRDHEDGGFAPKALTPGKVTRDFPGWRYDRQLAAHYAKQLADAALVDTQGIASGWLGVHKAEGQTPPGGDPKPWIAQQVARWSDALRKRLVDLWREGWFLGARSARSVASTRAVDWGDWTPGNPTAARIVRTSADLQRWLETYGVATIRSIEDTRMGELADALHTSLEEGWSTDRLATEIEDVLVNPSRARMIANTETARAVSQGTLAEYRHAGVERVLWVSSEDGRVCPTCDANEALGAVPMGSVFSGTRTDAPPGHPNCRCAVVAVPEGMIVPPRDVTKAGPKGYIHGWVKVGADDVHVKETTIDSVHAVHDKEGNLAGHTFHEKGKFRAERNGKSKTFETQHEAIQHLSDKHHGRRATKPKAKPTPAVVHQTPIRTGTGHHGIWGGTPEPDAQFDYAHFHQESNADYNHGDRYSKHTFQVGDLTPTQNPDDEEGDVGGASGTGDPLVVPVDGKLYLLDGHHRAERAARGSGQITAWVPNSMLTATKFSPGKVHDKLSDHYPDKVLDWVKDAAWSDPTEIKLKHIDMARRPGGRDMKKVRSMAKEIRAGKQMKPIYLVDTPSAPPMAIADGYHRALAHQHAGKQTILAHVASVDEEHGPWDRAMHDAKLNKVGPKGYEHNWVFVGVPGTGGRVFHPQHGHGTVASHNGSSATVHFDSGHKADFAAGHGGGPPRLEPKPKPKPQMNPHVQRVQGMNQGDKLVPKAQSSEVWNKMTPEQRKQARRNVVLSAQGDLKVNTYRDELGKILADDRMKTLHEMEDLKGEDYFDERAQYEYSMMDVRGVAPEDMPIYGTANSGGQGTIYGDVTIVLKNDRVRSRSTITGGDSLNAGLTPIPLNKVIHGRPTDAEVANTMSNTNLQNVIKPAPWLSPTEQMWSDYMEVQIHGGVSVDDIQEVRFAPTKWASEGYRRVTEVKQAKLIEKLKARGISVVTDYDPDGK